MSTSTTENKDLKWYINSAIVILCFLIIPLLPPFGQITEIGMGVLGVFVGMLYGWLTVGFIWPSALGLVFLGFVEGFSITTALSDGWGDYNSVVIVILGFMFAYYVESSGLADGISSFFLTRKFTIGHPWRLIAVIFVCSTVLSCTAGLFAAIFVTWAILYAMMERLGYEKRSKAAAYILGTAIIGASSGMILLPFKSNPLLYVSFLTKATGLTIPMFSYLIFQIVALIALIAAWIIFGKFICRLDLSAITGAGDQFAYLRGVKFTYEQKFSLAMLILAIVIMMAPDILPMAAAKEFFKKLGVAGAFIVAMVIPAIVKKDGKPLINLAECTQKCSWDVVWLLVATMPVANAMKGDGTGIIPTIVSFVLNMVGDMNWMLFTVACAVLLGAVTQVTHNLIIAVVLFGPLAQVCIDLGGNAVVWFMVNYWLNMAAIATPAASAYSAIFHGNVEWIKSSDAYFIGWSWLAINAIVVSIVGFTIGVIIF